MCKTINVVLEIVGAVTIVKFVYNCGVKKGKDIQRHEYEESFNKENHA